MALTTEGEVLLELNLAFNAADGRRPADHSPCGFRLGGRLLLFPDLMVQAMNVQIAGTKGLYMELQGKMMGNKAIRVSAHLCRGVRTHQPSHSGSVPQGAGEHAAGDLFLLRACLSPMEFKTTFKFCTRMSLKEQRCLVRLMLLSTQVPRR